MVCVSVCVRRRGDNEIGRLVVRVNPALAHRPKTARAPLRRRAVRPPARAAAHGVLRPFFSRATSPNERAATRPNHQTGSFRARAVAKFQARMKDLVSELCAHLADARSAADADRLMSDLLRTRAEGADLDSALRRLATPHGLRVRSARLLGELLVAAGADPLPAAPAPPAKASAVKTGVRARSDSDPARAAQAYCEVYDPPAGFADLVRLLVRVQRAPAEATAEIRARFPETARAGSWMRRRRLVLYRMRARAVLEPEWRAQAFH